MKVIQRNKCDLFYSHPKIKRKDQFMFVYERGHDKIAFKFSSLNDVKRIYQNKDVFEAVIG